MYKHILKKDFKRKKTMNIILLIFITISAMFMASSGSNVVSIMSATDNYIKNAGVADYIILSMDDPDNNNIIEDFLNNSENIDNWFEDDVVYISSTNLKDVNEEKLEYGNSNTTFFDTVKTKQQKFYDDKDQVINNIKPGEVYVPSKFLDSSNMEIGDKFIYDTGSIKKELLIKGTVKDSTLGSTMMGAIRIILGEEDFNEISNQEGIPLAKMYSINPNDLDKFTMEANNATFTRVIDMTIPLIKLSYIMDTVIAMMLFIVSICLIIIAMVVLRFTIVFTLSEEFREIGIMKAIGIHPKKIRGLYIVKYLIISIVGSIIGYALSLPLSRFLIKQVSMNIVIEETIIGNIIGIIAVILMVALIMLFCYRCTKIVKKYSPIDAIRNGTTGERFKRKSIISLSKSKLSSVPFMAINDIMSGLKRFATMIIAFTLGIIIIIIPINTINTLKSDKLIYWFGLAPCDYFLSNETMLFGAVNSDRSEIEKNLDKIEEDLKEEGIEAEAYQQAMLKTRVEYGDNILNVSSYQYNGTSLDENAFMEGTAPQNENEIAMAYLTADTLGVKIGDTAKSVIGEDEDEFIITAIFQSMMNQGTGILLSEKYDANYKNCVGAMNIQISLSEEKVSKEKLEEILPEFKVQKPGEYISDMIGDVAGTIRGPQIALTVLVILVNMLVVVLVVKSFITKEKSQIGLLKSIGFTNRSIISWQMLRIGIVMIISIVLGTILSGPLGQVTSGMVFKMMGASKIEFVINPLEVYVFYPMIIFICTMLASFLAVLGIRRIHPREIGNIE